MFYQYKCSPSTCLTVYPCMLLHCKQIFSILGAGACLFLSYSWHSLHVSWYTLFLEFHSVLFLLHILQTGRFPHSAQVLKYFFRLMFQFTCFALQRTQRGARSATSFPQHSLQL